MVRRRNSIAVVRAVVVAEVFMALIVHPAMALQ
jgi:hypothetical protein